MTLADRHRQIILAYCQPLKRLKWVWQLGCGSTTETSPSRRCWCVAPEAVEKKKHNDSGSVGLSKGRRDAKDEGYGNGLKQTSINKKKLPAVCMRINEKADVPKLKMGRASVQAQCKSSGKLQRRRLQSDSRRPEDISFKHLLNIVSLIVG